MNKHIREVIKTLKRDGIKVKFVIAGKHGRILLPNGKKVFISLTPSCSHDTIERVTRDVRATMRN